MIDKPSYPKFRRYAWNVLFALMYPFLVTFSLLFTAILWVFSGLSSLIVRLASGKGETGEPEADRPEKPPLT